MPAASSGHGVRLTSRCWRSRTAPFSWDLASHSGKPPSLGWWEQCFHLPLLASVH